MSETEIAARLRKWSQARIVGLAGALAVMILIVLAVSRITQSLSGVFLLVGVPVGWILGPRTTIVELWDKTQANRETNRHLFRVLPFLVGGTVLVIVSKLLGVPLWIAVSLTMVFSGMAVGYIFKLAWGAKPRSPPSPLLGA